MAAAEAQGLLPANLRKIFSLVLEPKVDWKDRIRALVMRAVGSDEYSWRALDRRLIVRGIGAPGRLGYTCGIIVIGVDTSGSIWASPKTLEMFFAEMGGILEDLNPEIVHVVWCDAAVHRVDEVTDPQDIQLLRAEPVPGGGGTDFRPVFDWVREQRIEPDALIYLTDLMGTFPSHQPEFPVIWGTICDFQVPWGEKVLIPKQSER
jgi:predicted metal-dependent peptidase